MAYIPKRGDIIWTDFDPSSGHEQAKRRPALVLSIEPFNKQIKLALVAPITSTVRGHGFEVKLETTQTKGVVLCQQVKTIDYLSRGADFIEKAPKPIVDQVLTIVRAIVD
jgi:mRNA interferase MazF